jgi:signal transduction histidine kinase
MGGEVERKRAKEYRSSTISAEVVANYAKQMDLAEKERIAAVANELKKYPPALHEIRKYNRTIKQEAERLCRAASPSDADNADPSLVRIWKSSELMTYQFEILELIANETLVDLPRKTESEVYKIFHKCVRIYELEAEKRNISVSIRGSSPRAIVCDKTFPIIPTVLLENAIRHGLSDTEVRVRVEDVGVKRCRISVSNIGPRVETLPDIFEKGVSVDKNAGGQGVGLYLAQLVARQHGTLITLDQAKYSERGDVYTFALGLETL